MAREANTKTRKEASTLFKLLEAEATRHRNRVIEIFSEHEVFNLERWLEAAKRVRESQEARKAPRGKKKSGSSFRGGQL